MSKKENPMSDKLETIDLSKVTLEDLRVMKNPSFRDALVSLIRNPGDLARIGHQNHGSHGDHSTDAARFIDIGNVEKR